MINKRISNKLILSAALIILVLFTIYPFRIDLSADKRYSISNDTKKMVGNLKEPLHFTLYLNGDLNTAFHRLRKSTIDLIRDLEKASNQRFTIELVFPSDTDNDSERELLHNKLIQQGLIATEVFMKDKEGKSIRKIIFPWLKITSGNYSNNVSLLSNLPNLSGEENIHLSIENLEFSIASTIRRLNSNKLRKVAFLEGHGELSEAETYRITKALSMYYQVDRGNPGNNASVLNDYEVLIIASPSEQFSETTKFILDQYLMQGGKILWFINGVQTDIKQLSKKGNSPAIPLDLNLSDLFFRYGIRIEPVILQDLHSSTVPLNIASVGNPPHFEPVPWLFGPYLLTSNHPITLNLPEVKSSFNSIVSVISKNPETETAVLLASSGRSRIINTPSIIALNDLIGINPDDFNLPYQPVAVLTEGFFNSAFANRIRPEAVITEIPFLEKSQRTAQIFVAGGDIIRNETSGVASDSTTLPLGFDRFLNHQLGNEEFIVNAVNYLAGNQQFMQLRSKNYQLRLLRPDITKKGRTTLQLINIVLPLILLIAIGWWFNLSRKRRYGKKSE